jgi:hypothetical protein
MKVTFSFSAGALVRKEAIFQLKRAAQSRGLSFSSIDNDGWLATEYSIMVEGPDTIVQDYLQAVEKWAQETSTG